MDIHVVSPGETLENIAQQYGVTVERIMLDNELPNPANLVVGQSMGIRYPQLVHTIATGDTLTSIAQLYGVSVNDILQKNPWVAAQEGLTVGDELVIEFEGAGDRRNTVINGYCYPFIDRDTLRKTLPFLTYLSIFTYGFTPEGDLVTIDDEELIGIAQEFGVGPVMMLAPMSEDDNFDPQIAHEMFINPEGQSRLIDNIIINMEEKGYVGLDIDFEYILPEDKDLFISFIAETKARLEEAGFFTMAALAPKTSGEMTGLLYEAHDYPAIGAIVDYTLLMTYEWGYLFGPPMPTSPIQSVRRVLEYGVSTIPSEKILMGVPNYSYDWALPFVQGESMAEALSNQETILRASQVGAVIEFDEETQSPFYTYTDAEGIEHIAWFDDVRSMDSKLRLIPEFDLAGAGVWQIMNFFPGLWMVVNSIFVVEKIN